MLADLTLVAAIGAGLNAGVFFAFSTFVMPALARLPAAQGVAAMNAINVAALNRWFMGALFGTAAVCLALAVVGVARWVPGSGLRLAGSLLFLAGTVAVTAVFSVPRNEALAALAPESGELARVWTRYLAEWGAWNHVRTASSLAAAVILTLAVRAG
jgi:uncharacterized membrane protein